MSSPQVQGMIRTFAVVMLTSVAVAQNSQQIPTPNPSNPADSIPAPAVAPPAKNLPPPPPGKSTVIGGAIGRVDPVRDEITLRLFGSNDTMKVFYDERTQVYVNGKRIGVLDLRPENHASVETTLDGTRVFALRIHVLTTLPEGDCRGLVESYDPGSGRLVVASSLSHESVHIDVPSGTRIVRVGQQGFASGQSGTSDLVRGSLVDVKFQAGQKGRGVATHIDVMATPGSQFTFDGQISMLDFSSGHLGLLDTRENQTFEFHFDPYRLHNVRALHEGSKVRLTAEYDGSQYQVVDLTPE
jgi:hypothetical protein